MWHQFWEEAVDRNRQNNKDIIKDRRNSSLVVVK